MQGLRASATTMNDLANGIAAISLQLSSEGLSGPPLIDVAVDGESVPRTLWFVTRRT